MAYFECIVGNGGSVGGIPLIVNCSADFAGTTISVSDGTTTLTAQCPSSSPYTVEFELPNDGTWTVSGTISGTTYTESILIQASEVELLANVDITIDVYSAASDTVSYTGVDGQTHTITTDSSGHASATITINTRGSAITFTSSVANDPDNLSNNYSKTISLTSATTEIYICPDVVIYWYGLQKNIQIISTANGWSPVSSYSLTNNATFNTNSITISEAGTNKLGGVGSVNSLDDSATKLCCIAKGIAVGSVYAGQLGVTQNKNCETKDTITPRVNLTTTNMEALSTASFVMQNNYQAVFYCLGNYRSATLYALWAE